MPSLRRQRDVGRSSEAGLPVLRNMPYGLAPQGVKGGNRLVEVDHGAVGHVAERHEVVVAVGVFPPEEVQKWVN